MSTFTHHDFFEERLNSRGPPARFIEGLLYDVLLLRDPETRKQKNATLNYLLDRALCWQPVLAVINDLRELLPGLRVR